MLNTHQKLFLRKNYTGNPTNSVFTPWTLAEVQTHLATGWGAGVIEDLKLELLYGPELEVLGNEAVKGSGSYNTL